MFLSCPCWGPDHERVSRHVTQDFGAQPDASPSADRQTGSDAGAGANENVFAATYAAREPRARADMHAIGQLAVVVNGGCGVYDTVGAEARPLPRPPRRR